MSVYVGSAKIDENGNAHGGRAGDNNGKEVATQLWYKHKKGWRVVRPKDPATAERMAAAMQAACDNPHIGYDQWQRDTLLIQAAQGMPEYWTGSDVVTKDTETDCSALVRVCVAYAFGHDIIGDVLNGARFSTANQVNMMLKTGMFEEMKGAEYTDSSNLLKRGDVLVTRTQGHTVMVLTNGSKVVPDPVPDPEPTPKQRLLKKGCKGDDVADLQTQLHQLGYDLGKWGIDGDFGGDTFAAVKAFQTDAEIDVDGIVGKDTRAALENAVHDVPFTICNGRWNVRDRASLDGHVINVVKPGDVVVMTGVTVSTWRQVRWGNGVAWISEGAFK